MLIRAYPFVGRRKRSLTHKRHFLLTLFSKNFVFLNHIGYATALSCYFGYKLCVVRVDKLQKSNILSLPLLGGFASVRRWSIVGLVLSKFKTSWTRFISYAAGCWWGLYQKGWKSSFVLSNFLYNFETTLPWRLVNHRFWRASSLGKWEALPFSRGSLTPEISFNYIQKSNGSNKTG